MNLKVGCDPFIFQHRGKYHIWSIIKHQFSRKHTSFHILNGMQTRRKWDPHMRVVGMLKNRWLNEYNQQMSIIMLELFRLKLFNKQVEDEKNNVEKTLH